MMNDLLPIDYESPQPRSNRAIRCAIVFTAGSFLATLLILICLLAVLQPPTEAGVKPTAIVIGSIAMIGLISSFVRPGRGKTAREQTGARIGVACGIVLWVLLALVPILMRYRALAFSEFPTSAATRRGNCR